MALCIVALNCNHRTQEAEVEDSELEAILGSLRRHYLKETNTKPTPYSIPHIETQASWLERQLSQENACYRSMRTHVWIPQCLCEKLRLTADTCKPLC